MLSLSLILAGYNEEDIVTEAINDCVQVLSRDFEDFEILLIDDGSTDSTASLMQQAEAQHECIRFLPNIVNLNFGTSVLRGLYAAKKELLIYNAIDLPLDPSLIKDVIKDMGSCDMLVLERIHYEATTWRKFASLINQLLLRILFPGVTRGNPVLNYIQVFRRSILPQIKPLARSPIFVWPEMIFRAKYIGLNVGNRKTPVQVKNVRGGSFGKPSDIIWGLYDMCRFRIRKWMGKI